MLLKLLGILKAIIASSTIRNEPCHFSCLVCSIVLILFNLSYRWIVVLPFLIRRDYVAVFSGKKIYGFLLILEVIEIVVLVLFYHCERSINMPRIRKRKRIHRYRPRNVMDYEARICTMTVRDFGIVGKIIFIIF